SRRFRSETPRERGRVFRWVTGGRYGDTIDVRPTGRLPERGMRRGAQFGTVVRSLLASIGMLASGTVAAVACASGESDDIPGSQGARTGSGGGDAATDVDSGGASGGGSGGTGNAGGGPADGGVD